MGERCSGTNFLQKTIETNFNLKYSRKYGHKHFFGNYNLGHDNDEDNTLFIAIIRDPVEWIDSFIQNPHHIPDKNKKDIDSFLFNPFYSIHDEVEEENLEDRNIYTKERYSNIFEMRKVKNNFLIYDLPKLVKNYTIMKYEDLRDRYDDVLSYIQRKFNLLNKELSSDLFFRMQMKGNTNYIKIKTYKDTNEEYNKKNIKLDALYIYKIYKNLDKEQENLLGYM
jgi:hypothetical protein